jgi:hypothetical protein
VCVVLVARSGETSHQHPDVRLPYSQGSKFKPLGDVWLSSLEHAQTRCPDDCSVEWLEPHVGDADLNQASSQSVCECRAALKKDRVSGVKEIKKTQRISRIAVLTAETSVHLCLLLNCS